MNTLITNKRMKLLNLSIEIKIIPHTIESTYLSRRSDFVSKLSQLSELAQ